MLECLFEQLRAAGQVSAKARHVALDEVDLRQTTVIAPLTELMCRLPQDLLAVCGTAVGCEGVLSAHQHPRQHGLPWVRGAHRCPQRFLRMVDLA
jgi:hypothetical protein